MSNVRYLQTESETKLPNLAFAAFEFFSPSDPDDASKTVFIYCKFEQMGDREVLHAGSNPARSIVGIKLTPTSYAFFLTCQRTGS